MTFLALLLKPLIAPFILFGFFLPARWGAVAAFKWMPAGRVKRVLLDRTLLDRCGWWLPAGLFLAMIAFYLGAWYYTK